MADATTSGFGLGDTVRMRGHDELVGRIIELRGNLGPGGAEVFRVEFRWWPRPTHTEVLADQMELVAAASLQVSGS